MQVQIETPRWSFVKYERVKDGGFKPVFWSLFPTPFNYGFIIDSEGDDGSPLDVIVLGPKLEQGRVFKASLIGRVLFTDDDKKDDKYIVTMDGERRTLQIRLFFTFYAKAKFILNLFGKRRLTNNVFHGIEWFQEAVTDLGSLNRGSRQGR